MGNSEVVVEDGTLNARAAVQGNKISRGIRAAKVTVARGTLNASASTKGNSASYAIDVTSTVTVTDGKLTAAGSTKAINITNAADFTVTGTDPELDRVASGDSDGKNRVEYEEDKLADYKWVSVVPAYDLYVGGVRVNAGNKDDIPFAGHGAGKTAAYDPDRKVLTLTNAEVKGKTDTKAEERAAGIYSAVEELIIKTEGNNTVTGVDYVVNRISGIVLKRNAIFQGNGTLTVREEDVNPLNTFFYGIYCSNGTEPVNITVAGGTVKVYGNASKDKSSCGICTLDGTVSVTGGVLEASAGTAGGGDYGSSGILAKTIDVSGGTIIAKGMTEPVNHSYLDAVNGLKIGEGLEAAASTNISGFPRTSYSDSGLSTYRWLMISKPYPLYVGGVKVMEGNADDVLGNGKVSYRSATKTLELKDGAEIIGVDGDANSRGAGVCSGLDDELTINFSGTADNSITGAVWNGISYGIYSTGDVRFTGTGMSLKVSSGSAATVYGIFCRKQITDDQNNTIEIAQPAATGVNYGLWAESLHVKKGTLTVKGGSGSSSTGIQITNTVTVEDGKLNAQAFFDGLSGHKTGLYAAGLKISGGAVTADGGNRYSDGSSYGIEGAVIDYAGGDLLAIGATCAIGGALEVTADMEVKTRNSTTGECTGEYLPEDYDKYMQVHITPKKYDLYVGGVQVTAGNRNNIPFPGYGVVGGKASFDPVSRVLTLSSAKITGDAGITASFGAGIYSNIKDGLTIETVGNNTVTGAASAAGNSLGILAMTNLTFCGTGTVDVQAAGSKSSIGIACNGALITVESGIVNAIAAGSEETSYGVQASDGSLLITGGKLSAKAGTVTDLSSSPAAGIIVGIGKTVTIEGGVVTAEAGSDGDNRSTGISAGNIIIQDGKVTAKGYGLALSGSGKLTVSDYISVTASAHYDGTASVPLDDYSNLEPYKWIKIEMEIYQLFVGGVQVTAANKNDIPFAGHGAAGTASYDPVHRVLKLDNARITGDEDALSLWGAAIYSEVADGLTVETKGENTVTGVFCNSLCNGMIATTPLTVKGDGVLSVQAEYEGTGTGIYGMSDMTVESGTVNVSAKVCGIDLSGGSTYTLHVTGGELAVMAEAYGIHAAHVIVDGGKVSATAQKSSGDSAGLSAILGFQVKDGTVIATGAVSAMDRAPDCGAYTDGKIAAAKITGDLETLVYEAYEEAKIRQYQYVWIGSKGYGISITGGTAAVDGSPATEAVPGAVVTITAGTALEGKLFDHWTAKAGAVAFADADAAETTFTMPGEDVVITAEYKDDQVHIHTVTKVEGKAATCTEAGAKEYYTCECGMMFEDEACTKEITDVVTWKVIPALGHKEIMEFDEVYHWKKCTRCGSISDRQTHEFDNAEDRSCKGCTYKKGLDITIADEETTYVYTGSAIRPTVIVKNYARVLTEGVDYTVTYKNNVKASLKAKDNKKPVIIVKGKGNYTGTTQQKFEIRPCQLSDVTAGSVVVVKGSKAAPILMYNGYRLTAKDYTNPDAAKKFTEDGKIDLTGKGNFAGKITIDVKVVGKKKDLKKFTVKLGTEKPVYDGNEQKVTYTVTDAASKEKLTIKTDYDVIFTGDRVNAGTVKMTFIGLGDYTGSVVKRFTIKPKAAAAGSVEISGIDPSGYTYEPLGVTPDLQVSCGGTPLTNGKDYTVAYSNHKKVGDGKYTVKFIGNYKGSKAVQGNYKITPAGLTDATEGLKISVMDQIYKNKAGTYVSKPVVSVEGVLIKPADYIVSYYADPEMKNEIKGRENNITIPENGSAAVVYVKITGKGNFGADSTQYATASYRVCRTGDLTDLSKAKIIFKDKDNTVKSRFDYTGREVTPTVTVQIRNGKSWQDVDSAVYEVAYHNNIQKGKATVVVKAVSGAVGGRSATFSIVAGNVSKIADLWKKLMP